MTQEQGPGRGEDPYRTGLPQPGPSADGTVLRPQGASAPHAPVDGTVLRPQGPPAPHAPLDGTVLRPRAVAPDGPPRRTAPSTAGAALRPQGPALDSTVLRPAGPAEVPPPRADGTVLRQPVPADGTVLRPTGPVDTTAFQPSAATIASPGVGARRFRPDEEAWSATSLTPPPSGWVGGDAAGDPEPPGWVPDVDPRAGSAFSPEEGGRRVAPALATDIVVPKVQRGLPVDEPEGGRYERPQVVAPRERIRLAVRPAWIVAAVMIVLGGVGGAAFWQSRRPVVVDPEIPTVETTQVAGFGRGDEAVRAYLTALSEGNIEKALSYGPMGGQGSQVLLQPAAVRASMAEGRISAINVPPTADANASQIRASYTVGSQAVDTVFRVVKAESGSWRLAKTTTTVPITAKRSERLRLFINGQDIPLNIRELEVVPGTYTLSTTLPLIEYLPTSKFTVQNLDYSAALKDLPAAITPAGKQALTQAAQESFRSCMERQELAPQNCPHRLLIRSPDQAPRPGTVKRRLTAPDPIPDATWTVSPSDPAIVEAVVTISIDTEYTMQNGDETKGNPETGSWTITADVTKARWQDIPIEWRSR